MTAHIRQPGFQYMALDDFEELLADKPENEKWELIGGRVVKMMVGARWEHHRIVQNVNLALANLFRDRGSPCRVYTETFWLKERFLDLAVFPDVMVHCGKVNAGDTSVSDPTALFEVVSPGSAARDRLEKNDAYGRLPSLRHYVMIDRDFAAVEALDRVDDRQWASRRLTGLSSTLRLEALAADIPLAEIYRDVLSA